MNDPRFNSVHLPGPRRQDYRRAREGLFQACGHHTLHAESPNAAALASRTLHQNLHGAAAAEAQFWLTDQEFFYPLKVGLNTIGRAPDNDIIVPDEFISRRHCAIVVHADTGRCELHDTASKNGTYLNDAKLAAPTTLRSGDEIRVCDRRFVFVSRDAVEDTHTHAE